MISEVICQVCGVEAPTRSIVLYQHVGAVLIGVTTHVRGQLCRRCIDRHFLNYSLVTVLLGWWGLQSFLVTPVYLGLNVFRFMRSRSLEAPAPDARVRKLRAPVAHRHRIVSMLAPAGVGRAA